MSALAERFRSICVRRGEDFTIGAVTHRGIFTAIAPERAATLLSAAALQAAPRPLRAIYVAQGDAASVDDVVEWHGLSLTVLAIVSLQFGSTEVARMIVAA